jgi:protein-disulfide isomerase
MQRARQEAAAKQARRRRIVTTVGVLVILGLVAAIAVVVVRAAGHHRTLPEVSGKVVAPAHVTSTAAIPVGSADAPVTVAIWFDYMCPACGAFEKANGSELARLVADGTVRLELHPIAFLDDLSSGTEYSTRSASAVAAVADAAPDTVWDFHTALYGQQPAEGSHGLTDQQIADIATGAGVPAGVVAGFSESTFRPWIASTTRKALDSGIEHTPTIKIDGTAFQGNAFVTGPLTQAIESAAADQ